MRYLVVLERSDSGFGAYVPDLPGCIAVGETETEARQLIREAVDFHFEGLLASGESVRESTSISDFVEVDAA